MSICCKSRALTHRGSQNKSIGARDEHGVCASPKKHRFYREAPKGMSQWTGRPEKGNDFRHTHPEHIFWTESCPLGHRLAKLAPITSDRHKRFRLTSLTFHKQGSTSTVRYQSKSGCLAVIPRPPTRSCALAQRPSTGSNEGLGSVPGQLPFRIFFLSGFARENTTSPLFSLEKWNQRRSETEESNC